MLGQLLDQSQNLITKRRTSFARRWGWSKVDSDIGNLNNVPLQLLPHYIELLKHGNVVWGTYAQANQKLFSPGTEDLPANTVYSSSDYFCDHPDHLLDVAHAVFSLKYKKPQDADLARIAALITDEMNSAENILLPDKLTGGQVAYLGSSIIHRSYLPNGQLSDAVFPMLLNLDHSPANMVLPLRYWSSQFAERWGQWRGVLATMSQNSGRSLFNADAIALQNDREVRDGRDNPAFIMVTPAAVRRIRSQADELKMSPPFFVVIGVYWRDGQRKHSIDLAPNWDRDSEICIPSCGLNIVVRKDQADQLKGSEVDFSHSIYATGLFVRNPNS